MRNVIAVAALLPMIANGDMYSHTYQNGEHVELWVNKVGPYANPQEAYEYYTLPYCAPDNKHHPTEGDKKRFNEWKSHSIGERLSGHALWHSGHDVTFGETKSESCITEALSSADAQAFANAIQHRWVYQMYLDDLPVLGMVGEMLPSAEYTNKDKDDLERPGHLIPFIYTSRTLYVSTRGGQVVEVDLTSDPSSLVEVKEGIKLKFTLFVEFTASNQFLRSNIGIPISLSEK